MSGRRAKALRRGAMAAVNLQAIEAEPPPGAPFEQWKAWLLRNENECIPEYLGYGSREGLVLVRRGRWATIPGSWRRVLRKWSAWQRGTRRVVTGSTPPGPPGKVHDLVRAAQAERLVVVKPRGASGFASMAMAALMLAAFPSGESR